MNAVMRPLEIVPEVVPMTVEALRLLDEQGFFDTDPNRYELIDGTLIMTPPPGTAHYFVESKLTVAFMKALFSCQLDDNLTVQNGGAFRIGDRTLLGPDFMLVTKPTAPREHAADDILVMIEIAWSSRERDMKTKAELYAGAGIEDYWVLDVPAKTVIIHRDPEGGIYQSVQAFREPAIIASLREPSLQLAVADLF
jgi:Uma2 family endonuclease